MLIQAPSSVSVKLLSTNVTACWLGFCLMFSFLMWTLSFASCRLQLPWSLKSLVTFTALEGITSECIRALLGQGASWFLNSFPQSSHSNLGA